MPEIFLKSSTRDTCREHLLSKDAPRQGAEKDLLPLRDRRSMGPRGIRCILAEPGILIELDLFKQALGEAVCSRVLGTSNSDSCRQRTPDLRPLRVSSGLAGI